MAGKKGYRQTQIGAHTLKPETLMMSYGYDPTLSEGAVKPPVFLTSTFLFSSAEEGEEFFNVMAGRKEAPAGQESGLIYSRFNHPNVEIVEDRLAVLEEAESAAVFSSGMGAISAALLSYLRPGDVVLHSSPLYGGTETLIRGLLPDFGIEAVEFFNALDSERFEKRVEDAKMKGRVAMIFVETPANPTNALFDFMLLRAACDSLEQEQGLRPVLVCDNTLLGPIFQKAVPQGVDLALYSLTKYVGGHSDLVAGAACGSKAAIAPLKKIRGAMGLNLDPHTSWMISRSLETLTIRMHRAAETGRAVANWLAKNPYIPVALYHPEFMRDKAYQDVYARQCTGPGSTFSFVVDAPRPQVFELLNSLRVFKLAVSLGGTESLVCHPASTTHSGVDKAVRDKAGVSDGLVRLSIGLEHPDDLMADLDYAFSTVFSGAEKRAAG